MYPVVGMEDDSRGFSDLDFIIRKSNAREMLTGEEEIGLCAQRDRYPSSDALR